MTSMLHAGGMIPTRCRTCGAVLDGPEMSALALAHYLRRIPRTNSLPALSHLAREIVERFPEDEATPRLTSVIAGKVARLTRGN